MPQEKRNYRVGTYLSQGEMDTLNAIMIETRMSPEQVMLIAFKNLCEARKRMNLGYDIKFVNENGEEYVERRIVVPGEQV